jgi:hypothetical protein
MSDLFAVKADRYDGSMPLLDGLVPGQHAPVHRRRRPLEGGGGSLVSVRSLASVKIPVGGTAGRGEGPSARTPDR